VSLLTGKGSGVHIRLGRWGGRKRIGDWEPPALAPTQDQNMQASESGNDRALQDLSV